MSDEKIIYPTPAVFAAYEYEKEFEPVQVWDRVAKEFTDEQFTLDGLPVWESRVQEHAGYEGEENIVRRIRVKSRVKPIVKLSDNRIEEIPVPSSKPLNIGGGRNG